MHPVSYDGLQDTDEVGHITDSIIPAPKRLEVELEVTVSEIY